MIPNESYSIILALTAALAAGLVGSFALMKKMTLAGDVISHVALPGLGIALLFGASGSTVILGGGATLLLGILLIWQLQKHTELSAETTIGVIFAASLAIGTLAIPTEEELIDSLFGNFGQISFGEFAIGMTAIFLVIAFIVKQKDRLIIALFSPELATAAGINLHRINLYFLLAFGLTVISGLQFLGALLMGALIIVPAAIGRQLTHQLNSFLLASSIASILSVAIGIVVANIYELELGPVVVAIASIMFLLSLLKKKK